MVHIWRNLLLTVVSLFCLSLVTFSLVPQIIAQEEEVQEQEEDLGAGEAQEEENDDEESTEENSEDSDDNSNEKKQLEQEKAELEEKLESISEQKDSLSTQIEYMDTQIYLADVKKQETEENIEQTQKEIELLGTRIEGLDGSLDQLSKTLLQRVADTYKNRNISIFEYLLNSENANDLVNRYKYYQITQANNQKILVQVQQTKNNFEEQKTVREKKKDELADLTDTLETQSAQLEVQQQAKETLLTATQNDEEVYKQRIAEINRKIEAFKTFVRTRGLSSVGAGSLGGGEGGWYLSQRDERWASMKMGESNETILDVGCFITSIAMVFRSKGIGYTPVDIAGNPSYFSGGPQSACFPTSYGTAYMCVPSRFNGGWPNGLSYKNISTDQIDSYLNAGNPVIAGVNGANHYVVLKKVADDGGYIMNDPIYGPDLKLSEYYSLSGPLGVFE